MNAPKDLLDRLPRLPVANYDDAAGTAAILNDIELLEPARRASVRLHSRKRLTRQEKAKLLFIRGLQAGQMPLAPCYLPPSLGLEQPEFQTLFDTLRRAGNGKLLTDETRRRLASGQEHFKAIARSLTYPIDIGDKQIVLDYIDIYRDDFHNADVFEFCAGDCQKAAWTYKEIGPDFQPKHKIFCDQISMRQLCRYAADELTHKGLNKENISCLSGNIFEEEFWRCLAELKKRLPRSSKPAVVLLRGATINDFSEEQIIYLINKIHHVLGADTIIHFSIDNTLDELTNKNSYNIFELKQFMLNGSAFCIRENIGLEASMDVVATMNSIIDIIPGREKTRIQPRLVFDPQHTIRFGGNEFRFAELPFEPIEKFSRAVTYEIFKRAGVLTGNITRLSFRSTNPAFANVDLADYRLAA